jgi:RimJ/RimL family protein N-acetyltransferase
MYPGKCDECSLKFVELDSSNLDFFVDLRNLVRQYLHDPREFSLDEAKIWLQTNISSDYLIVSDNEFKNNIGYWRLKLLSKSNLQIGLDIHPNFQGMGNGKRIYTCMLNHWDLNNDLKLLSLQVLSKNTRALNLYRKMGFTIKNVSKIEINGEIVENIDMVRDINSLKPRL